MIKRNPIVAVDVDLTVVDSLNPWLRWFYLETGQRVENKDGAYDLVPEMKRLAVSVGLQNFDPYSYWKREDLYDDLRPLGGSVETLEKLALKGCQIIFVSLCDPYHIKSKIAFLKKWFPYHKGFIDTADKHFVKYDVLIDDREKHIVLGKEYNPEARHILFTQVARQTVKYEGQHEVIDDWWDIDVKVRSEYVCDVCGCDIGGWMQYHASDCPNIPL